MFVGISDKVSKVGTTDIPDEEFYVHARKRPWDDWQFFLERSPIYYAGQSRTPLLILHGKDDPRVHPSQSLELYRRLPAGEWLPAVVGSPAKTNLLLAVGRRRDDGYHDVVSVVQRAGTHEVALMTGAFDMRAVR